MAYLNPNDIQYLAVHCSATKPSQMIGASEINQWHLQRGWAGIGYHFVIRRDPNMLGSYIEFGRSMAERGAHVKGYNSYSLGICMVGGIDDFGNPQANFSDQQYTALYYTLKFLQGLYPNAVVQGHRDFPNVAKACPCFDVPQWWSNINMQLMIPPGINPGASWSY